MPDESRSDSARLLARASDRILGVFQPFIEPMTGGDLTRGEGRPGRARRQLLHVSSGVLDRVANPVRRGKVQIWQANGFGRYDHPNDDNPAPLDPAFIGFAAVETDDAGCYALKTLEPAAYPAGPDAAITHSLRGFRQARAYGHAALFRR